MKKEQPKWKSINMGEILPCQSFLRKKDGEILKLSTIGGVTVGQDCYYLPVDEVINVIKDYPVEESEDERIINNIKKVIGWYRGMFTEKSLMPEQYQEIDAWLEKQGEQNLIKHFCDCVHVGCHVNDCKRWCHSYQKEISYTDCNSNCNRYSKPINFAFNIGETITDGISTFKIANIKDNYYIADDGERVEIYMAHRYYTTIQNLEAQKPAWSEEDERQARQIERIVHNDGCTQKLQEQIANWFKSLKDKVQPQPKQEWSEEDEKHIHSIISTIECNRETYKQSKVITDSYTSDLEWFKSLIK